ncbi:unnamed protein product [Protopolystoma xenopodis]|uniref:Uncharacterized protein n=1 Tax=Protopolystoma xenopodis TaxID=117903 RepID=A0A448XII5_9PLAT|nr:unnamed protein product [Protopolystoma xenopodis]
MVDPIGNKITTLPYSQPSSPFLSLSPPTSPLRSGSPPVRHASGIHFDMYSQSFPGQPSSTQNFSDGALQSLHSSVTPTRVSEPTVTKSVCFRPGSSISLDPCHSICIPRDIIFNTLRLED